MFLHWDCDVQEINYKVEVHSLDLQPIIDFVNQATEEFARYRVPITLAPERLQSDDYNLDCLVWNSIPYGDAELEQVPDNRRGLYAFAVHESNEILPPHGYVLYIGIAGEDSDRPLRDRYRDYLNAKKVIKRARIARMIGTWHSVLRFYFAPVEDTVSSDELKDMETKLNDALLPPFSEGDLDAETKRKRRAFRV